MGRSRLGLLASTLLVLVVVSGTLLMHGFESVSPQPLATHTHHAADIADPTPTDAMVGCVFVAAVAVTVADSLVVSTAVPEAVQVQLRSSTAGRSIEWKPLLHASHELCVMRV